MRWGGAAIDPTDPVLPEGVEPLADHVTAPAELARRLRQIGLVERADAARLRAAPEARPAAGVARGRSVALGRLCGRRQCADRRRAPPRRTQSPGRNRGRTGLPRAPMSRPSARSSRKAEAEVAAASEAETEARNRWRELQREADSRARAPCDAERELNHITTRRAALTEAQTRLGASRDEAAAAQDEAQRALAELPPAAELEVAAERRSAPRSPPIASRSPKCAPRRRRWRARPRSPRSGWRRSPANSRPGSTPASAPRKQIAALDARLAEATTERDGLADAPRLFEEKRVALLGEVQNARSRAARGERRAGAKARARSPAANSAVRAALDALGAAREQLGRSEERCEGAKRRLSDIEHEIRDMLEVEPQGVAALAEIAEGAMLPDVAEVEADLEKLRRERERLGAVNLRAEEELREVETQHTSLTTERDDLVEAIKRLRQGIQNLNREARERLLASFEVVNGHFKQLFKELFGGGEAELQLIESDDPLEAGLEIMAKPPGKKLQSLSLLSGGEQALTAMALIFAVFLTNPAPICVLDEVDAPLDDHNVERFCDLLDEMTRSTETRFVIITHNPITMARMNRLYGVTMAERGVSQLVSVDLEAAVQIRDQQPARRSGKLPRALHLSPGGEGRIARRRSG